MMNETRERFLRGILERVSPERIVEIHFFPPIRQGQLESGVAVVALESAPITVTEPVAAAAEVVETLELVEPLEVVEPLELVEEPTAPVMAVASRLEVCTAIYRWTRKGPERGKWEFDFKTEGDASLPIVGTVVRGVEQRSGDELGALRMDADELHALLETSAWQRTTP
ncbi:MAG: hypothetical protein WCL36_04080 [bacterium]|jgi:hypothetical protein